MKQISQQIYQHLLNAKKILIIPHQHPDGDALGSMGALKESLNNANKEVAVFCSTLVMPKYNFVPHAQNVSQDTSHFKNHDIDTIVVLDSGDLRYAGVEQFIKNHPATIINIDHHPTNERYGHINLVIPTASSTAEIVFYLLRHNHIPLTRTMATCLLTGIITDTGNFTNSATTPSAMLVASELLRVGGNLNIINQNTVRNQSVGSLKLWGAALSRLSHHEDKKITYTYITQNDLKEMGVAENETDGIANFLNNLDGGQISLILKETADGKIKGSFRTTNDQHDVSALAKSLGGGGHKKAAGFTASGTIEEVLKKILKN